ncbi:hypothetical protein ACQP1W_01025 [Spirillospora sp. CA-255316]
MPAESLGVVEEVACELGAPVLGVVLLCAGGRAGARPVERQVELFGDLRDGGVGPADAVGDGVAGEAFGV